MKKLFAAIALALVAVCLAAIPALAAPGGGNGAARGDLLDYNGDYSVGAQPVVVGSFNVNATAGGVLRVVVNLSSAEEASDMVDLPIRIIIRAQPPYIPKQINNDAKPILTTNAQGQGNAILKIELPVWDPAVTDIEVMVLVNPGGSPDLFEGAEDLVVPLK